MKYLAFKIKNYRSISDEITVDISKTTLSPIIGINECGKTTILHAIFAFDHFNDKLNNGSHLNDINNLFKTKQNDPIIAAVVSVSWPELLSIMREVEKENAGVSLSGYKQKKKGFGNVIEVARNLNSKKYSLCSPLFKNAAYNALIAEELIRRLPYILYFDDFRDSVENSIEIKHEEAKSPSGWLAIIEELFRRTDSNYSVFSLKDKEERIRKSIISSVAKKLNETLTKEWQDFRLDETDALRISIEYKEDKTNNRSSLQLDIIEKDAEGNDRFFFIRNRSKGFYWFFNFVMKLEFNPKSIGSVEHDAIYLLDEPGSYLHASAQMKLCRKLKSLAERNSVIYCTHSHYLLDPDVIPLNNVKIAEKTKSNDIRFVSIHDYKGEVADKRSAFQPIMDALQIKPVMLSLTGGKILITEGISDYFAYKIFKSTDDLTILPSTGASSMHFLISIMIAWQMDYHVLWDNDNEGRKAKGLAEKYFGNEEAKQRFRLLPLENGKKKRILQDLFHGSDVSLIKSECHLPSDASFEKMMAALHYHNNRDAIVKKISTVTTDNFKAIFSII